MSGFSEDGYWWWDGQAWVPTSQVVIPDFGDPDPESVTHMNGYRVLGKTTFAAGWVPTGGGLFDLLLIPFLILQRPVFHAYRRTMLERVAAATTYLLGQDEPMVAGEVTLYPSLWTGLLKGSAALAVTRGHVLVMWIDISVNRPRSLLLVARPADVNIVFSWGFGWGYPTLYVRQGERMYPIRGSWRILQPEPVLTAWRNAIMQGQTSVR